MFSKALFIDFKKSEIEIAYLRRFSKLFQQVEFISRERVISLRKINGTEVLFCKIFTKIDKEIIDQLPKLKYIGVLATAFNAIDVKYARSKGLVICNLGGYSTEAVAEFCFAVLFEQIRQLEAAKQQARKSDFSFSKFMGFDLKNKTLGIIGAGTIGTRAAEIGLGLGMKVIYSSRKIKSNLNRKGAQRKQINWVLEKSDVVAPFLALNKETENIINKKRVNLLKQGSIFISLVPQGLIDQEAMRKKASKGEVTYIFSLAFDMKPALVKKFLKTKNCVAYPPIAIRTKEASVALWETFTTNIEHFAKGKLQNVVS